MKRITFIDNAKVLFIFLVVFGHMIQPITSSSEMVNTLYLWIYVFHMPAFILLSGFFAKGSSEKSYLLKLVYKLIIPYLIFQGIYTLFYFVVGSEGWKNGPFNPHWSLWFLLSLFCWHILLIFYKRLKPSYGILLAVVIGLAIGYISPVGQMFSLSRTFVFFPFFLIGYHLTREHLQLLKRPIVKISSIFIMIIAAFIFYQLQHIDTGWFLSSKSYAELGAAEFGGLYRFIFYVGAALMSASVLAWVPRRNLGWVSEIGMRTLYVYLLHGFFIQIFRHYEWFQGDSLLAIIGIAILSACIVIILSSNIVMTIFQPIVEGKMNKLRDVWKQRKHASQL